MNEVPDIDVDAALDSIDQNILDQIAALYSRIDPVPDDLVARSQFAITLDALEADVAELQRWEADALATRAEAASGVETITFSTANLTTMVTVTPAGIGTVRIDGWAAPGAGLPIELRLEGGSQHTVADEDGRFVFDKVRQGLAQFVLRPVGAASVITPSLQL